MSPRATPTPVHPPSVPRLPPVLTELPDTITAAQIALVFESGACMVLTCASESHAAACAKALVKNLMRPFDGVEIDLGYYTVTVFKVAAVLTCNGHARPKKVEPPGPKPEHLREPVPGSVTQPAPAPTHLDPALVRRAAEKDGVTPADLALNNLPPGVE